MLFFYSFAMLCVMCDKKDFREEGHIIDSLNISVILVVGEAQEGPLISCLSSISLNRACRYEILLVDLGTNESISSLLEKVATYYPEVRLLTSPKPSFAAAFNYAVNCARGQYVLCVDMADRLLPETLDKAWRLLSSGDTDFLIGQVLTEEEKNPGKDAEETVLQILPESVVPIGPSAGVPLERLRVYYLTMDDPLFVSGKKVIDRRVHARFVERTLLCEVPLREDLSFGEGILWNFEMLRQALVIKVALFPFLQGQAPALPEPTGLWASYPVELDRLLTLYRREIATWPARNRVYYYNAAVEYFPLLCRTYVFAQKDGKEKERFMTEVQSPFWRRVFKRAEEKKLRRSLRMIAVLGKTGMDGPLYRLCKGRYGGKK